jgi:hypothetical protein
MAYPGLPGGVGLPCAARSAALAGWTPRAAPASPPEATLKTAMFAFSTRSSAPNGTRPFRPSKHGHFPIKHGHSPIKHGHFPINQVKRSEWYSTVSPVMLERSRVTAALPGNMQQAGPLE